ncbi:MAG: hypothetical protein LIO78_00145 [Clostridiales bacterium]|nr:hypothetical protein [Clostridiales bacterium]
MSSVSSAAAASAEESSSGDNTGAVAAASEEADTTAQSTSIDVTSDGCIYVDGEAYVGYYKTDSYMYYSNGDSGLTLYSGLTTGGSNYLSASDLEIYSCSSRIYKDGVLYTGYYMNASGKMYTVKSGVYSLYTGALPSGTEYYKNGSGTATLSKGIVYLSGAIYNGYYMTTGGAMFYADANGYYSKYSGLVSGSSTYLAASDKQEHQCASRIYKDSALYTGYYMNASSKMYTVKSGVYSLYTGALPSGTTYYKDGSGTTTLSAGIVYLSGAVYTGYYMTTGGAMFYADANGYYSKYSGLVSGSSTYLAASDKQEHQCASRIYKDSALYTGYYMNTSGKMYTVTSGVYSLYTGVLSSGTKYYMSGTGYITLSVNTEYEDGVCLTGTWKFSNNYAYYYVGGKKVTGWYYIERNGSTYKYYFDPDDGHLVTNLYAYFGSSYKYKKCKLVVNKTTHNASLLGYDSSTNSYCIPYYSFIVSTAKKTANTPTGTYALSSNYHRKWFTFVDEDNDNKEYYYAYATLISGSGCWFHSEYYTVYGSLNSLSASTYNGLGTNQTSYCVRAQLYVAKLVYDIRDCYSGSIKVEIVANSVKGPFGKITLSSTTGKISSSTKTDPTGSSSYKGYIKQTAE